MAKRWMMLHLLLAVSLVQFTDRRKDENNAVVLSCLAINVMVPERDEASACHAVVRFVREHLENCAREDCFLRGDEARARGDVKGDRGERCLLFR